LEKRIKELHKQIESIDFNYRNEQIYHNNIEDHKLKISILSLKLQYEILEKLYIGTHYEKDTD